MAIDPNLVRHIARLARLELTDEELAVYQRQLSSILDYIDQLKKLDVSKVEPFIHPGEFANIVRSDEVHGHMLKDDALRNAPERTDDFFTVPKIIEE